MKCKMKETKVSGTILMTCVFTLLLIIAGCTGRTKQENKPIFLNTTDRIKIAASYYPAEKDTFQAVILIHMLGSNRHDYDKLAETLSENYGVVTFDLRGNGESDLNWEKFPPNEYRKMPMDVEAAKEYMKQQGYRRFAVIGGSIGANLALIEAQNKDVEAAVLLSPGLDYRGVKVDEYSSKASDKKVLIIASSEDSYSADSSAAIYNAMHSDKAELKIYDGAGHGTNMLTSPMVLNHVLQWLDENFPPK